MNKVKWAALVLFVVGVPMGAYYLGQRTSTKVVWLSDLTLKAQGRRVYIIDIMVTCSNGKQLGPLQADLNLTNGKFRIIRNDAGTEPDCAK